jgi:hypothetical protein
MSFPRSSNRYKVNCGTRNNCEDEWRKNGGIGGHFEIVAKQIKMLEMQNKEFLTISIVNHESKLVFNFWKPPMEGVHISYPHLLILGFENKEPSNIGL